MSAARLLAVISVAALIAFALRETIVKELSVRGQEALAGLSAVVMAVVVVGLMSALRPALGRNPASVLFTVVLAFAVNFGMQIAAALLLARREPKLAVPLGVSAGNRNMALFLTALPAAITEPTLLFIACYQLPMYLTPLLFGRWYARFRRD